MSFHEMLEEAFTGLEAAIVLIAFIVVAAVFSYVVLGAGFLLPDRPGYRPHSRSTGRLGPGSVWRVRDS